MGFDSAILNGIIFSLPKLREPMKRLLNDVSLKRAGEGRKDTMWQDPEKFPEIADVDLVLPIDFLLYLLNLTFLAGYSNS